MEEVHILLRANQPRDLPARCFIILSNNVPPANLVGFEHVCCDMLQGWTSTTGKGTVTMRTEWALRTLAPVNPTKYLRCVPMLNLMQLRSSFLDFLKMGEQIWIRISQIQDGGGHHFEKVFLKISFFLNDGFRKVPKWRTQLKIKQHSTLQYTSSNLLWVAFCNRMTSHSHKVESNFLQLFC